MIFAIGGAGYSLIEIIWRGYTHISMALAGGLCLAGLFFANSRIEGSIFKKSLVGAFFITLVEFCFGCVVNRMLGLGVWDYSKRAFNIMGQICPVFSLLWFLICIPAFKICMGIQSLTDTEDNNVKK